MKLNKNYSIIAFIISIIATQPASSMPDLRPWLSKASAQTKAFMYKNWKPLAGVSAVAGIVGLGWYLWPRTPKLDPVKKLNLASKIQNDGFNGQEDFNSEDLYRHDPITELVASKDFQDLLKIRDSEKNNRTRLDKLEETFNSIENKIKLATDFISQREMQNKVDTLQDSHKKMSQQVKTLTETRSDKKEKIKNSLIESSANSLILSIELFQSGLQARESLDKKTQQLLKRGLLKNVLNYNNQEVLKATKKPNQYGCKNLDLIEWAKQQEKHLKNNNK